MVEKTSSVTSIGFGAEDDLDIKQLKSQPLPYGQYLYNICIFAIKCEHNMVPLLKIKDSALWLPYLAVSPGQKWINSKDEMEDRFIKEQFKEDEQRLLVKKGFIQSPRLVSVSRFQLPSEEFICRMTFCAKWKSDPKSKIVCCQHTAHFEWHSIDEVIEGKNKKFWGKEVSEFGTLLNKSDEDMKRFPIGVQEVTNTSIYRCLEYKTDDNEFDKRLIAESLAATNVNRIVIEKLYSDFIQHCYPSLYMCFLSFTEYTNKMELQKINDRITERAFIAMNYENNCFLTFEEFLLGLIVLEPNAPQNFLRGTHIFRYYDSNSDHFLDSNDIRRMVIDMKKFQKISVDTNGIDTEVNRIMSIPDICDEKQMIPIEKFVENMNCEELKATSVLFRSVDSLHKLIADKNIYEPIGKHSKILTIDKMSKFCPKHSSKDFKIAVHSLKMTRNGRQTNPKDIRNTDGKDIQFKVEDRSVELQRSHSIEVVNKMRSTPNYVIEVIRELVKILNKTEISEHSKKDFKLSTSEKLRFEIIESICHEIKQIFRNESRVLKLQSPFIVLGDIHGNIKDLLTFEEQFWRNAPQIMPTNLLFAGDYVDRGEFGLECVLYLYAMKILNPTQVFLLRGNHEVRHIQRNFTFERECIEKHKKNGPKVFELINETFDVLPIAAVIDENIFCVHGGIPCSLTTIEELMNIPVEIKHPENECPAVQEILWSDPLNKEEYEAQIKFLKIKDDSGYIHNTKRSTAYYFSEKALNAFLSINRLTHVIRAHELVDDGYKLFLNGKVISVFSTSGYCGLKNKAAVIRVDGYENEGVIRIITLETKNDLKTKKK